mmetsp:Transcript_100358/g.259617  ORF Transcript_100358/g.259617 Transcript_100358/m.259617 type:complete len:573 (-) Transcript_100358:104-1822(-)
MVAALLLFVAAAHPALAGVCWEAHDTCGDTLQLLQVPSRPASAARIPRNSISWELSSLGEQDAIQERPDNADDGRKAGGHAADEEEQGGSPESGPEGEQHGAEEVSIAMVTTSYLLLGFLITNFVMLWLVNWPDANVRSYTWKMISAAVSIYLAVLLTNTMSGLILDAVLHITSLASPHVGDKFKDLVVLCTKACIFMGCFVAGNMLCYHYRHQDKWLYASHTIGGHITAFAGIGALEALNIEKFNYSMLWFAVFSLAAGLAVIRFVTMKVRRSIFGEPGATEFEDEEERQADKEWREGVREGEDDACSIIASFMVNALVMASFFSEGAEEEHIPHPAARIKRMLLVQGVCMILLVITTYLLKVMDKSTSTHEGEGHSVGYTRMAESTQLTVAMIMAWLSLTLFSWVSAAIYPSLGHEFLEIITAAILTGCAILLILILDRCADTFHADDAQHHDDSPHDARTRSLGYHKTMSEIAVGEILDSTNVEKAIRSIIDAMSLAVGLAWERAFHVAIATFITTHTLLREHRLLAELGMAVANCFLMMPVWLKFIVPMARKTEAEHMELMRLDDLQG